MATTTTREKEIVVTYEGWQASMTSLLERRTYPWVAGDCFRRMYLRHFEIAQDISRLMLDNLELLVDNEEKCREFATHWMREKFYKKDWDTAYYGIPNPNILYAIPMSCFVDINSVRNLLLRPLRCESILECSVILCIMCLRESSAFPEFLFNDADLPECARKLLRVLLNLDSNNPKTLVEAASLKIFGAMGLKKLPVNIPHYLEYTRKHLQLHLCEYSNYLMRTIPPKHYCRCRNCERVTIPEQYLTVHCQKVYNRYDVTYWLTYRFNIYDRRNDTMLLKKF